MPGGARRQPLRRCILCRRSSPKGQLLRFVATAGGIVWDTAHQVPGRGAYVHRSLSCWGKMLERGRWDHAFRGKAAITQEGLRELQLQTRAQVPELHEEPQRGAELGRKVRF